MTKELTPNGGMGPPGPKTMRNIATTVEPTTIYTDGKATGPKTGKKPKVDGATVTAAKATKSAVPSPPAKEAVVTGTGIQRSADKRVDSLLPVDTSMSTTATTSGPSPAMASKATSAYIGPLVSECQ
jgi:hypothetical protein